MDTSAKVLIVGGTMSLTYGFLLGLPLSAARMQGPTASHHLVTAHLSAIIQGAMLLALSAAIELARLPSALEIAAAAVLVSGSVLFVAGAVANWRQRIDDHFAVRSVGWKLLALSGPVNIVGIVTVLVGVLRGVG